MDPLELFNTQVPFDKSQIKAIYPGTIYTAVELKNGALGVCANLNTKVEKAIPGKFDFDNLQHRIVIQAYYNAIFNVENVQHHNEDDIVEQICAKNYEHIVMIGLFKPVLQQLKNKNIAVKVFDFLKDDPVLTAYKNRQSYIARADCLIVSATTIFNKTFNEIIHQAKRNAEIHILGPSTPLTSMLFRYKPVRYLHGIEVKKKAEIIETILANKGTRSFMPFCHKVMLQN